MITWADDDEYDDDDEEGGREIKKCSDTRPDKTTCILWELLDAARHSYFVGVYEQYNKGMLGHDKLSLTFAVSYDNCWVDLFVVIFLWEHFKSRYQGAPTVSSFSKLGRCKSQIHFGETHF